MDVPSTAITLLVVPATFRGIQLALVGARSLSVTSKHIGPVSPLTQVVGTLPETTVLSSGMTVSEFGLSVVVSAGKVIVGEASLGGAGAAVNVVNGAVVPGG